MRTVWSNTTASGCLPAGKCIWTGPSGRWLLAMGRLTFFMQPVLYSQRSQESGQYPTLKEYIAEHFPLGAGRHPGEGCWRECRRTIRHSVGGRTILRREGNRIPCRSFRPFLADLFAFSCFARILYETMRKTNIAVLTPLVGLWHGSI